MDEYFFSNKFFVVSYSMGLVSQLSIASSSCLIAGPTSYCTLLFVPVVPKVALWSLFPKLDRRFKSKKLVHFMCDNYLHAGCWKKRPPNNRNPSYSNSVPRIKIHRWIQRKHASVLSQWPKFNILFIFHESITLHPIHPLHFTKKE